MQKGKKKDNVLIMLHVCMGKVGEFCVVADKTVECKYRLNNKGISLAIYIYKNKGLLYFSCINDTELIIGFFVLCSAASVIVGIVHEKCLLSMPLRCLSALS